MKKKVIFVPKAVNPPNVPECRCIEDFWSTLKAYVYNKGREAENIIQLRSRIIYCLKKFNKELVQVLVQSTFKRLD